MGTKNTLLREKSKIFFEILFSLNGSFWGQKESFKTILGSILGLFCCYYSRLPWPDPKWINCIRVAILHHHLSQYRFSVDIDYSILKEVERVVEWLRKWNVDIVFHGHQHCPGLQTRLVDRKFLTIIAGGSLGVTSKFRYAGGGMPLMYQLVYPNSKNCAERLCQAFDLYDETWIPSRQIKLEEIPLGYQNKL